MELSVAAPLWGWALGSLLVPVLIHFFARRWQQPTRFAALRFLLPAAEQGRARRISDWWLLLLRLLLLTALIGALMMPTLVRFVARDRTINLVHPAVTVSSGSDESRLWLCDEGELRSAAQPCADAGQRFIENLIALASQQPDIAAISVLVPERVYLPDLALPTLPFSVTWQTVPQESLPATTVGATSAPRWRVRAAPEFVPLFHAANALSAAPLWQVLSSSGEADLVIGDAQTSAPVLWHDEPLPWRDATREGVTFQMHVDRDRLHIKVTDAGALLMQPERLAVLLGITDNWLHRAQPRWQVSVKQLKAWAGETAAAPEGRETVPLQMGLFLLASLLLMAERGVVHGRR